MFRRWLFRISYKFVYEKMFLFYEKFQNQRFSSLEELEKEQNAALQRLILHAFTNIPYYKKIALERGLKPEDIKCKEDLVKLPVLTKAIIKANPDDFKYKSNLDIKSGRTGGSTGEPLQYLMDKECYYRGVALNLRTFSQAGYRPGDQLMIMGGGSLVGRKGIKSYLISFLLHYKMFAFYGITEDRLRNIVSYIKKRKKIYLNGYASSIYLLAKYILDHNIQIKAVGGIFTTSEKLTDTYRNSIAKAFPGCEIFNNYGLNDGGVSATECKCHNNRLHINYGRSILEVVDDQGQPIVNQSGHILATSLYNYAQPFIRYDTEDEACLVIDKCTCGMKTPGLVDLHGRETDIIKINDKIIAAPVLTVLMGTIPEITLYRVVQKDEKKIEFNLCTKSEKYKNDDRLKNEIMNKITQSFLVKVPEAELEFVFVESEAELLKDGRKHKIIINNNIG